MNILHLYYQGFIIFRIHMYQEEIYIYCVYKNVETEFRPDYGNGIRNAGMQCDFILKFLQELEMRRSSNTGTSEQEQLHVSKLSFFSWTPIKKIEYIDIFERYKCRYQIQFSSIYIFGSCFCDDMQMKIKKTKCMTVSIPHHQRDSNS